MVNLFQTLPSGWIRIFAEIKLKLFYTVLLYYYTIFVLFTLMVLDGTFSLRKRFLVFASLVLLHTNTT